MAAHLQPAYAHVNSGELPVTERLTLNTLILPLYHQLTDEDQQTGHRRVGEPGGFEGSWHGYCWWRPGDWHGKPCPRSLPPGDHQVVGMLDDSVALHGTEIAGVDVLGGIDMAATRRRNAFGHSGSR